MIKNTEELKTLILWAKAEKVKSFSIGDIKVELSDLALIQDLQSQEEAEPKQDKDKVQTIQKDLFEAQDSEKTTDEDLFWSAR